MTRYELTSGSQVPYFVLKSPSGVLFNIGKNYASKKASSDQFGIDSVKISSRGLSFEIDVVFLDTAMIVISEDNPFDELSYAGVPGWYCEYGWIKDGIKDVNKLELFYIKSDPVFNQSAKAIELHSKFILQSHQLFRSITMLPSKNKDGKFMDGVDHQHIFWITRQWLNYEKAYEDSVGGVSQQAQQNRTFNRPDGNVGGEDTTVDALLEIMTGYVNGVILENDYLKSRYKFLKYDDMFKWTVAGGTVDIPWHHPFRQKKMSKKLFESLQQIPNKSLMTFIDIVVSEFDYALYPIVDPLKGITTFTIICDGSTHNSDRLDTKQMPNENIYNYASRDSRISSINFENFSNTKIADIAVSEFVDDAGIKDLVKLQDIWKASSTKSNATILGRRDLIPGNIIEFNNVGVYSGRYVIYNLEHEIARNAYTTSLEAQRLSKKLNKYQKNKPVESADVKVSRSQWVLVDKKNSE
jgi:hypothetical protein